MLFCLKPVSHTQSRQIIFTLRPLKAPPQVRLVPVVPTRPGGSQSVPEEVTSKIGVHGDVEGGFLPLSPRWSLS